MAARALSRLLTGPLAFLLAGVVDALLYGLVSLKRSLERAARGPGRASTIRRR